MNRRAAARPTIQTPTTPHDDVFLVSGAEITASGLDLLGVTHEPGCHPLLMALVWCSTCAAMTRCRRGKRGSTCGGLGAPSIHPQARLPADASSERLRRYLTSMLRPYSTTPTASCRWRRAPWCSRPPGSFQAAAGTPSPRWQRVLHIHLRKCAGTLLNHWLNTLAGDQRIWDARLQGSLAHTRLGLRGEAVANPWGDARPRGIAFDAYGWRPA